MNYQQRNELLENQSRAFTEGIVEYINEQWVFFDTETDEASLLEEYLHQEVEIHRHKRWRKGFVFEDGKIKASNEIINLRHHDTIRIRKNLIYSLEKLIKEINDDTLFPFISTLNSANFSVYDCIYCYNHLSFLNERKSQNGVNFIVFDNGEQICSVQHHFCYVGSTHDRFEFTLSTGKRMIIEKLIS